jgi:catechol 2,3-dioxygenase
MTPSADLRIERVTLRVSEVERSAEFYAGLVGLRVASLDTERALLADPAAGGEPRLELIAAGEPGRAPIAATGLYHVAFLYPGRSGLGAAIKRIADGAYDFVGAADHAVSEALYLQDPDNLGIELYRDRPRGEWPMDGERIAMFTRPLSLAPIVAEAAEGVAEQTATGVGIGHVHLRVADLETAKSFWLGEVGLELMAELPGALFMAANRYHHHIGANTWQSAGAEPASRSGPGLEQITISGSGRAADLATPEGVVIHPA